MNHPEQTAMKKPDGLLIAYIVFVVSILLVLVLYVISEDMKNNAVNEHIKLQRECDSAVEAIEPDAIVDEIDSSFEVIESYYDSPYNNQVGTVEITNDKRRQL